MSVFHRHWELLVFLTKHIIVFIRFKGLHIVTNINLKESGKTQSTRFCTL